MSFWQNVCQLVMLLRLNTKICKNNKTKYVDDINKNFLSRESTFPFIRVQYVRLHLQIPEKCYIGKHSVRRTCNSVCGQIPLKDTMQGQKYNNYFDQTIS